MSVPGQVVWVWVRAGGVGRDGRWVRRGFGFGEDCGSHKGAWVSFFGSCFYQEIMVGNGNGIGVLCLL